MDEPTSLPDGTEVELRVADDGECEGEQEGLDELHAFEELRASLKPEHSGKWVVFVDRRAIAFRHSFQEAAVEAARLFPDGRALIAPVDEEDIPEEPVVRRAPVDEVR